MERRITGLLSPKAVGTLNITENGNYDVAGKANVHVNIPQPTGNVVLTTNGIHNVKDYETATVEISNNVVGAELAVGKRGVVFSRDKLPLTKIYFDTSFSDVDKLMSIMEATFTTSTNTLQGMPLIFTSFDVNTDPSQITSGVMLMLMAGGCGGGHGLVLADIATGSMLPIFQVANNAFMWNTDILTPDGCLDLATLGFPIITEFVGLENETLLNMYAVFMSMNTAFENVTEPLEGVFEGVTLNIVENTAIDGMALIKAHQLPTNITVNVPIPEGYVKPSGTYSITKNGTYTITNYEKVNINVTSIENAYSLPAAISKLITDRGHWANQPDASYLFYYYDGDPNQFFDSTTFEKCPYANYMFHLANPSVKIQNLTFSKQIVNIEHMFDNFMGDASMLPDKITFTSALADIRASHLFNNQNTSNKITYIPTKLVFTASVNSVDLSYGFYNCNITEAPDMPYIVCRNLSNAFQGTDIVVFPDTNLQSLVYASYMFCNIKTLTEVGVLNTPKLQQCDYMFSGCELLETVKGINLISITNTPSNTFKNCKALKNLTLYNIKLALQISDGTSWGHLITKESLIQIIGELIDTGSSKRLTMGSTNLAKLADVYVRVISEEPDENGNVKLPFEVCSASDEGAMLITNYVTQKHWSLA